MRLALRGTAVGLVFLTCLTVALSLVPNSSRASPVESCLLADQPNGDGAGPPKHVAPSAIEPDFSSLNLYTRLGVKSDAKPAEIKTAFYQLAKKYHPDLHGGTREANQLFETINEAWEALNKSDRRAEYDQKLASAHSGGASAVSHSGSHATPPPHVVPTTRTREQVEMDKYAAEVANQKSPTQSRIATLAQLYYDALAKRDYVTALRVYDSLSDGLALNQIKDHLGKPAAQNFIRGISKDALADLKQKKADQELRESRRKHGLDPTTGRALPGQWAETVLPLLTPNDLFQAMAPEDQSHDLHHRIDLYETTNGITANMSRAAFSEARRLYFDAKNAGEMQTAEKIYNAIKIAKFTDPLTYIARKVFFGGSG